MEIARVDLRGIVPSGPGWEATRAAVTASMVAHGCVLVAHDAFGPELRQQLFTRFLPQLFAIAREAKQRTTSAKAFSGYLSDLPNMSWESLPVEEPTDADPIHDLANVLWPEGNPEFCETMMSLAKNMLKLEEMVETLVLEGLGVRGESIGALSDVLGHGARMSHYGVPPDTETSVSMTGHYDPTMTTTLVQHEVEGLELQAGDGRWVAVPPEPGTFAFIAGEQFRVVTNGRVPACLHRVRTPSNRERFSVQFNRHYKEGIAVRVLNDLVDAEHPLLFNPLRHEEYSKWRFSEEALKFDDPLKAFCGVEKSGALVV